MSKIAYIVDSASVLKEKEARDLGIEMLPLHLILEGNDYLENDKLDINFVSEKFKQGETASTSQPSPGEIMALLEKLKKQGYTGAVYSSIGSGLSATYQGVVAAANACDFKLYPIDSLSIGPIQVNALLVAKSLIEKGSPVEEAVKAGQKKAYESHSYVIPQDLQHLKRGGRLTPTAAALGSLLKIKPILKLDGEQGGKIDAIDKVRTTSKAYKKVTKMALDKIDPNEYAVFVAYFGNYDLAVELQTMVKEMYPKFEPRLLPLSVVIGAHTGNGVVALQVVKK